MLKNCLFVIAMGLATVTNASDWMKLGDDGEREVYLDKESIKFSNASKTQRSVWTKDIFITNTSLFKKSEKLVSFTTYDCSKNRLLINQIIHYSKTGKLLTDSKEGLRDGWQDIPPDSLFDGIHHIVCSSKI